MKHLLLRTALTLHEQNLVFKVDQSINSFCKTKLFLTFIIHEHKASIHRLATKALKPKHVNLIFDLLYFFKYFFSAVFEISYSNLQPRNLF